MTRFAPRTWLAALLLAGLAVPSFAQDWTGRGRQNGSVIDEKGEPIVGATVKLWPQGAPETGPKPIATDKRGKWRFLGLAGGVWLVRAEAKGFAPYEVEIRITEADTNKPLDLRLVEAKTAVARANPGLIEAQEAITRGDALLEAKKGAEARAEFESALPKVEGENRAVVLRRIAQAQMLQGDNEGAVTTLKGLLAEIGDDPDTLTLLVDRLTYLRREEEAKQYVARLPQGASLDPNTLVNMGINLYNENKLPEALEKFEQVVALRPEWADGYYFRGLAELGLGKMAEAKVDFEKVLALDPNNANAGMAREFLKSL